MKKRGEEFWAQVRRAYENGEGSYEVLAERFGVCRQAVGLHRKRRLGKKCHEAAADAGHAGRGG